MSVRVVSMGLLLLVSACSGGSGTISSGGGANTASLDGTYDITMVGGDNVTASEMTVRSGHVEGTIVYDTEGTGESCKIEKDRTTFTVDVSGSAVTGTFKRIRTVTGDKPVNGRNCSDLGTDKTYPLTGSREGSGAGVAGTWQVTYDRNSPFLVIAQELSAKAWSHVDKKDTDDPELEVAVANGVVAVTSRSKKNTFAARRR